MQQLGELPQNPFQTGDVATLIAQPVIIIALIPFVLIFLRAAWLEYRRWKVHGPSENKRSAYDIDEDAPSYTPPESETETDDMTETETKDDTQFHNPKPARGGQDQN
ncbi:hypothetical protein BXY70_0537 [Roseovarius halotolerans]|uniref:Uncharacterized protein n=1 Tax=Roseovarius halotolerans TaxID=505353 RepID=A0A1X6YJL5_9RHOB|nr:hypothetical protein [Roseovarius halotolerans]RKT34519.1 hypothetical protein BXY70_0537 [Roseovarius halotolerans]SLN22372.1 hypothetical protein ROH8110_00858 [Roseovarius halotolerans]